MMLNSSNSDKRNNNTPEYRIPPPYIIEIQKAVADQFRVPVTSFREKSRLRRLVYPRQVAMYLCRRMTKHSYQEIGWQFGNRNHATVMHAVKAVESRITKDRELAMIVYDLYTYLRTARSRW